MLEPEDFTECWKCGSIVFDTSIHAEWHTAMAATRGEDNGHG